MENFLPTKVEFQLDPKNENKGQIFIEPCWPGYGITWSNALRRVLLASLSGTAVTAVKIKGVKYEFSTLEGVKEDILEIILNLKSLRLKILTEKDELIKLSLKASGEKKVKAGDIEKSSDVKIVNPDLLIATLTDKKVKLEMDIWVTKGYGWVPSEEKSRAGLEIGTIVTDSIFSPVLNVSVNIENMRVGKRTDFDKIILGIETDGSISPIQAFLKASQLLKEQFDSLLRLGEKPDKKLIKKAVKKTRKKAIKKPIKKAVKKAIKKPVKKAVKKAIKKPVKKKAKK